MDRPVVAAVLAGGTGSRLYPASRSDRPKQFLPLGGDESLLSRTVDRTGFADETLVVTRERFRAEAADHAPDATVVAEPEGKDTGPAVVYATHRARELVDRDPVVVCLPADHHVPDAAAFGAAMARGARVAADTGRLVAFGVEPTRPDTGYGYVEPGADHGDYRTLSAFHEKPDERTAAEYVDAGYYWNAGMFAWTPSALFAAARDTPLGPLVEALERDDPDPAAGFAAVEATSVDYAVMERTADAVVVPVGFAWDDLGTWDALARTLDPDDDGTVVDGAETLTLDARDNVVASDGRHVSLVGVSDLCVVAYDDRVLVVPNGEAGRVREVADRLKADDRF
ncbi:mannose-1-phosphate guanylyltransferase [Candidatus Halobonum tyrrellensis]|uniref:Mannose-1-phosphate guanylyltransferase n=1 Tax=Candidatus Halobonum tyrrellensis G22 TaxID=1324957 RepID=V4HD32_9EURY|nr:sugar phosphate nucleotidyltransferase [Candidatus Halobonum tyrrellensis]ESP88630.1 mannose-1-phosphate guanylyltransferase [Candidatus Halobonum tyrrellensis G22]